MSASRREREQFIANAVQHGIHYDDACKLLRFAATLQRLAEAQCNGDWPYDNGERKTVPCSSCESGTVREQLKRMPGANRHSPASLLLCCPDCRTTGRARTFVATLTTNDTPAQVWSADFQGDPRGYVFRLHQGAMTDDECKHGNCRHRRIGVPA